jgi:hypothetical protein
MADGGGEGARSYDPGLSHDIRHWELSGISGESWQYGAQSAQRSNFKREAASPSRGKCDRLNLTVPGPRMGLLGAATVSLVLTMRE